MLRCPNPVATHWECFCCKIVIQRNSVNKHCLSKQHEINHYEYIFEMNRNNE